MRKTKRTPRIGAKNWDRLRNRGGAGKHAPSKNKRARTRGAQLRRVLKEHGH